MFSSSLCSSFTSLWWTTTNPIDSNSFLYSSRTKFRNLLTFPFVLAPTGAPGCHGSSPSSIPFVCLFFRYSSLSHSFSFFFLSLYLLHFSAFLDRYFSSISRSEVPLSSAQPTLRPQGGWIVGMVGCMVLL